MNARPSWSTSVNGGAALSEPRIVVGQRAGFGRIEADVVDREAVGDAQRRRTRCRDHEERARAPAAAARPAAQSPQSTRDRRRCRVRHATRIATSIVPGAAAQQQPSVRVGKPARGGTEADAARGPEPGRRIGHRSQRERPPRGRDREPAGEHAERERGCRTARHAPAATAPARSLRPAIHPTFQTTESIFQLV